MSCKKVGMRMLRVRPGKKYSTAASFWAVVSCYKDPCVKHIQWWMIIFQQSHKCWARKKRTAECCLSSQAVNFSICLQTPPSPPSKSLPLSLTFI